MWKSRDPNSERCTRFFLISTSHDSLVNYYETNFAMIQHHKYSLSELESMMPWERRIYIELLIQHLKEEKERMESEKRNR